MTPQEIQYKAQSIINKWRDDDSAPYIEFVEELAHMIVPEPSEDLEEVAEEYLRKVKARFLRKLEYPSAKDCFEEGAKWQYQKDRGEFAQIKAKTWSEGFDACKEQMMKEAVEADVNIYRDLAAGKSWAEFVVEMPTNNLGEKVKIIIVKKD